VPLSRRPPGRVSPSRHLQPLPWEARHATNGQREARSSLPSQPFPSSTRWGLDQYAPVMREDFGRIGGRRRSKPMTSPASGSDSLKMTGRAPPARAARRLSGARVRESARPGHRLLRASCTNAWDDLGIDFCVCYPTAGLGYHRIKDTRQIAPSAALKCRGRPVRGLRIASSPRHHPHVPRRRRSGDRSPQTVGYKVIMVGASCAAIPALEEKPTPRSSSSGTSGPHRQRPRLRSVWAKCRESRSRPASTTGHAPSCCKSP